MATKDFLDVEDLEVHKNRNNEHDLQGCPITEEWGAGFLRRLKRKRGTLTLEH